MGTEEEHDTTAPEWFAPPELWPEFGMIALPPPICRRERTPTSTRWCLWPICFELFSGDAEPDLSHAHSGALAYNRIIMWKRVRRTDVPPHWHSIWRPQSWRKDGLVELTDSNYRLRWSKDAQRNAKKWDKHLGRTHSIKHVSFEEYKAAYKKSRTYKHVGVYLLATLGRQYALPEVRPHIEFFVVENNETNAIVAGNAIITSPTYNSTTRMCTFIYEEARSTEAMTGLVDYWFKDSLKRGIKNLVFMYFWQPGEPREWKGFSTFKSHFVERYITYPPIVWRFQKGRLF
ncbi:MAG TPA: hypothetical protein VG984_02095 [Candidatus Paceibacterota bacterium]|nr:hypothetical protein [Candidatus Paceibacterota bacterium]